MNTKLLLLAVTVAVFSSCSSAYKSGQTPDDVYYSPVRNYSEVQKEEEARYEVRRDLYEDREIRMGINDYRWRTFDTYYDYSYSPYRYGYQHGYYYNPYYSPYPVYNNVIVTKPVVPSNTTPRVVNLGSYSNGYNTENAVKKGKFSTTKPVRTYNNSNKTIKEFESKSYNSNDNNRSYTPSSSGTKSSSSSSSSSSGTISRPNRNNK
jgi:hypothetical protein